MTPTIFRRIFTATVTLGVSAVFVGCGAGTAAPSDSPVQLHMQGRVFGGEQPVAQASILLYAAGTGGNGSAARPMLNSGVTVTTDNNGLFSITGDYSNFVCAPTDEVYIVAKGGNPGLAFSNNPALVMVDVLGPCSQVQNLPYIYINELTTVAAAWTLAPFYSAYDHIGSTSTNTSGLANAFGNARVLVDSTAGALNTLPPGYITEGNKIDALADALAVCENSNGGSTCSPLFTAATTPSGSVPTDTFTAAVNIVSNPGNNVTAVFNAIGSFTPFPTTYTAAPNDWSLSMTIATNGVLDPTALGVDSKGNVWVANFYGPMSLFNPEGTAIGEYAYPYSGPEAYGLVIDPKDQSWGTLEEAPSHYPTRGSITTYKSVASGTPGVNLGDGYDTSLEFPVALSTDAYGNIYVANYGNSTASVYSNAFSPYSYSVAGVSTSTLGLGAGNIAFPVAIAADASATATFPGGFWLANQGDNTATHLSSTGTLLARPTCCNGANGIAVDSIGSAWVTSYYSSAISEISAAGTVLVNQATVGGLSYPAGIVVDGAQNLWVANYRGQSISEIAGNGAPLTHAPGSALSPSNGYGRDANLLLPFDVAVDASGNLWVTNFANNDLVVFYGIATPTKTPVMPTPTAP